VLRTDVPNARKAGFERDPRVARTLQRLLRGGHAELEVRIEVRGVGEVRMHVDQAGKHPRSRQVDLAVGLILACVRRCNDLHDAVAANDQCAILRDAAGPDVEQVAGADQRAGAVHGSLRDRAGCPRAYADSECDYSHQGLAGPHREIPVSIGA
jgi:hypothetical protein